jgi:hypothetical protein
MGTLSTGPAMVTLWLSTLFLVTILILCGSIGNAAGDVSGKYANFGSVVRGRYLQAAVFRTLTDLDLKTCAKECVRRTRCLSVNYEWRKQVCELNDATPSMAPSVTMVTRTGFLYSEKSTWGTVRCRLVLYPIIFLHAA